MSRRKNLEVDEDEFRRVRALILIKAARYGLNPVGVSDRLVVSFSPEQVKRLVQEVAEAGFELIFKEQAGYSAAIASHRSETRATPRFGSDPRAPKGGRHPKAVDWANEGLRGSRS